MKNIHGIFLVIAIGLCIAITGCVSEPQAESHTIPDEAFSWNEKGIDAYAKDNYTEALGFFDMALQADPEFSKAWNNRGMTLMELGRYQEAADSFNKTLEIDPRYPGAREKRDSSLAQVV